MRGPDPLNIGLGLRARKVDSHSGHRLDRERIELAGFEAGAFDFKRIAAEVVEPCFRHLAAGAVVDADKESSEFAHAIKLSRV